MECLSGIINNPLVNCLMAPVKERIGHLISYTEYVKDMRTAMADLNDKKRAVEERKKRNEENCLEIPNTVKVWLQEVTRINGEVESVLNDAGNWFDLWNRYMLAKKALKITEDIMKAKDGHSTIEWTDDPVPLGRIDSTKASTSRPSSDHPNEFQSRQETFTKALEALGPNHKSHMVALCGMGGVGKTTMMKKLKEIVSQKNFKYIVPVDIVGGKTDPIDIQRTVAYYLGIDLKEENKSVRAHMLRQGFKAKSDGGNNKFLLILDDVWQPVNLEDIGLSLLPDQGVDFKVLLTSRIKDVCAEMGVEDNSILNVEILTEEESQRLFRQVSRTSDPELHKIGENIVRKCGGLPMAINTIARTLIGKGKNAWNDALSSLKSHDIDQRVKKIFEMSYNYLQDEETKSVFLLCGLFPEDWDIPIEELVMYGWGLKLFKIKNTITEARDRMHTCIEGLIDSNLLIKSDDVGCVKMHDLVREFVLDMFSKVEYASVVNHGNMLGWPENEMKDSCKRISLTCKSMCEFPGDLKFPNLSILKLMHGDKSLKFPQDFYEKLEKIQVISYDEMKYPLLPSSPQCSTNLRVLHLRHCSLMFNCSSIGNLLNLEVLSFAGSTIECLPSTIGNLKKLRLLDLTDCFGLRIDDGVLINLVKLEELYMLPGKRSRKGISFTDENCNEMAIRSENLLALEFQLFENSAQPKNLSFKNLERFKISVGRSIDGSYTKSTNSVENTLQLVTNKGEVLESRINMLFEKTEVLCLSVGDMNDILDLEVKSFSRPQSSSFYNLRVLVVSECAELRYLFTLGVANTLSKLEHLEVNKCDNMKELIHSGSSGEDRVTFPKLKFLSLCGLPKLLGLCCNVNIIELPQLVELQLRDIPGFKRIYTSENKIETSHLLKEEVLIPKLEELFIDHMENLKEIWPYEFSRSEQVRLRKITVRSCTNLVNMFPCNPMSLLHHLEEIDLLNCGSIEVLFDIDLENIGEIEENSSRSSLRNIKVEGLGKLREMWKIKGAYNNSPFIRGFQVVERIKIKECERFRNLFTPTNTNFDLGALKDLWIEKCGENRGNNESVESSHKQEQTDILLKEETSRVGDSISNTILFPSCLTHSFPNLHKVELWGYKGVDVVFEIECPSSREPITTHHNQQPLFPYLEELDIRFMEEMSHVWKCNWNIFFILQKQVSESPFHNLTTITLYKCRSIKYLFSPLMAKLLSNLKKISIKYCDGIEEVVSNRDDEDEENTTFASTSIHTTTTLFPHLDSLTLFYLHNLKCIGGGGAKDGSNVVSFDKTTTATASLDQIEFSQTGSISWTLCQYSREIQIQYCNALSSVIPCYAAGQMQKLQVLKIEFCDGMKEVFETDQGMNKKESGCDEGNGGIPRLNNVIMLPNLKILSISFCGRLEHIFTFSALESLRQLQELRISYCKAMKVIVKEEEYYENQTPASSKEVVVFPHLKSIELINLPELMGFFLGKNGFMLPSLDYVMIKNCPQMRVFAPGGSTAPKLKYIHTILGKHDVDQHGLNFHVTATAHYQTPFLSSFPATSEGFPWSFHNLIELRVEFSFIIEKIIPSNELLQLQKLEKIRVKICDMVEEVFEALEGGTNSSSGFDESSQTTTLFKLPNLTQLDLYWLPSLRHIWKRNRWTVFEFPNLTKVDIYGCNGLKHAFSSSMVGSLLQLQELSIKDCSQMVEVIGKDTNVVVEEEEEQESDGKINEITLPRLKSLTLEELPCLKGFCLGKEDFSFPLLDTLIIKKCPAITTFTKGNSATPQLIEIETLYSSFYAVGKDINSIINIKQEDFKRK